MTGIVHVFGILTIYNEWRFAWFSHSDKIASATTTGDVQVLSAMPSATTTANVQSIFFCDDEQEPLPDTFHYSRIYSVRDEEKDLPYRNCERAVANAMLAGLDGYTDEFF